MKTLRDPKKSCPIWCSFLAASEFIECGLDSWHIFLLHALLKNWRVTVFLKEFNSDALENHYQIDEDFFETHSLRSNRRALQLLPPSNDDVVRNKCCVEKWISFILFSDMEQISEEDLCSKKLCNGRSVYVHPMIASTHLKTIRENEKYDIFC